MLRTNSQEGTSSMRSDSRRKRAAVLDAAMALFIEQGFGSTSVDAVAARAGVSKATVYAHFENKDALFAAVMKLACNTVVPPSLADVGPDDEEIGTVLRRIGLVFLESIYRAQKVNLFRAIIMDATKFPEVGRMACDGPIARSHEQIGNYLAKQVAAGKLALPCPDMAASQFLGLLKTDVHMRLLLNQPANISRARLRRIVDCSVDMFLNGTLPRKSEGRGTRRAR